MTKINLNEIATQSIEYSISRQNSDGSFPPGHNGPYLDPETPVRATSHLLCLLSFLYSETGCIKYKKSAELAITYLLSRKARPYRKTFHCRNKKGKDKCNGLIGQAWGIEALVMASKSFNREDCYLLAEELFFLHPWDRNTGIWKFVEIDGAVGFYDKTFNHQLWFAAVASLLNETPAAKTRAKEFLKKVVSNIQLYPDGVIFHKSAMGKASNYLKNNFIGYSKELAFRWRNYISWNKIYLKSVGYHAFNLYALSMLKESFSNESFWNNESIINAINAVNSTKFTENLRRSKFGYYYNISGIEIAYSQEIFLNKRDNVSLWVERQFEHTFSSISQPFSRDTTDFNTSIARVYESIRLKNNYEFETPD